jgi:segregation and condensation protein A
MAAILQFRLKRLEAMRDAAARLVNRNRLGRDVFARGMPEASWRSGAAPMHASLYDLLTAYAGQRQRRAITNVRIAKRGVWSLKEARDILMRMIGSFSDWTALDQFLLRYLPRPGRAHDGDRQFLCRQPGTGARGHAGDAPGRAFAPLYMRSARRRDAGRSRPCND